MNTPYCPSTFTYMKDVFIYIYTMYAIYSRKHSKFFTPFFMQI